MLAVAWVIANRVRAGWQGGDWLKVLSYAPIHSASESSEMLSHTMPEVWEPTWRWVTARVEDIYDGTAQDTVTLTPSKEALAVNLPGSDNREVNQQKPSFFYANLNMPIRDWFLEKIIRSADHPRTVEIPPLVLFN